MSEARQSESVRKLDQSARWLRRISDWLAEVDAVDGEARDLLGQLIYKVDEALEEVGGDA